jgi:hypothetical protein
MQNLGKNIQIDQVLGYFAAGTTAKSSAILDMSGYDGVIFVAGVGTIIEDGTIHLQVEQDEVNAAGGMAALAGTAAYTVLAADALKTQSCLWVDVYRPGKQFVRATLTPAVQNAVILGVIAIRYSGIKRPEVPTSTVLKATTLASPDEA